MSASTDALSSPAQPRIHVRPEFVVERIDKATTNDVARPLSAWERVWNINGVRKLSILVMLLAAWQAYTVIGKVDPLMVPTFTEAAAAMWDAIQNRNLLGRVWFSVEVLLIGYAVGLFLAALLVLWATASRIGSDFLGTLTAMFNPLPAIALLPLAMLWFGVGLMSLIFVLVHSVLWAVALSTHSGFLGVSQTLRMVGRNYGLGGLPYVWKILIPAAFPSILTGMKVGWAFAWRTLIAAELVFGTASGAGGLGWFIFENSQLLDTEYVFAGLFAVILIGITVENVIFRNVELRTVNRWGMQR